MPFFLISNKYITFSLFCFFYFSLPIPSIPFLHKKKEISTMHILRKERIGDALIILESQCRENLQKIDQWLRSWRCFFHLLMIQGSRKLYIQISFWGWSSFVQYPGLGDCVQNILLEFYSNLNEVIKSNYSGASKTVPVDSPVINDIYITRETLMIVTPKK